MILSAITVNLGEIGTFLLGIAGVGAVSVNFYTAKKTAKTIEASSRTIEAIDHAVNGKPAGAQSIQSQVAEMHKGDFPPPPIPEYANEAALLPLVQQLVAMMEEQRQGNGPYKKEKGT